MNYTPTGNPIAQTRGTSALIRNEFALVQSAVNSKLDASNPSLTDGTANTQPFGDASTKIANTAFVAATAFSSALPAQTGNNGKFVTTDGTAASWAALPTQIGIGGQTTTAPITLTAASVAAQSLSSTSLGAAVTLPDATTLTKGVPVFSLYNSGCYTLLIKDSAGTLIGFIEPLAYAQCSLTDNATAPGAWVLLGASLFGLDAGATVTLGSSLGSAPSAMLYVNLDATRELLIISGGLSVHAVVWDNTAMAFGSPVLVRTADVSANLAAIKTSTDKVLVNTASSTAFQSVILSFSGTTITVNTAATATLAASLTGMFELVAVGTSWVSNYHMSGQHEMRAFTVSGTTPAIGAALITPGTGATASPFLNPVYAVSSSVVLLMDQDLTTIYCLPVSVSGSTLTAGTSASIATSAYNNLVCRSLPSGRWALIYENNYVYGAIVSVSGTVASLTTAQLSGSAMTFSRGVVHQIANQCIVTADGGNGFHIINVLTDNAGTAVAGTEIANSIFGYINGFFGYSATELWGHSRFNGSFSIAFTVGLSGNNPVITYYSNYGSNTASANGALDTPNNSYSSAPLVGKNTVGNGRVFGKVMLSINRNNPQVLVSNGRQPFLLPTTFGLSNSNPALGRKSNASLWWCGQGLSGSTVFNISRFTVA